MRFSGKVVIVTGAASGIGKQATISFAEEGANVILVDNYEQGLKEVHQQIVDKGSTNVISFKADVTRRQEIIDVVNTVMDKFGRIDILVNSAGALIRKNLTAQSEEEWDKVINVNLKGIFIWCQAISPIMKSQNYGRIINIASIAGLKGYIYPSYSASKAGVINFGRSLIHELAPYGITINTICPGPMETPMILPERHAQYIAQIPAGRLGTTDDVTAGVMYFASDEASFVCGNELVIDGGRSAVYKYFES